MARTKSKLRQHHGALRWCEEVMKETQRNITFCGKEAEPIFTKAIRNLEEGEHQPLWLCEEHMKGKIAVSPTGGR